MRYSVSAAAHADVPVTSMFIDKCRRVLYSVSAARPNIPVLSKSCLNSLLLLKRFTAYVNHPLRNEDSVCLLQCLHACFNSMLTGRVRVTGGGEGDCAAARILQLEAGSCI